MNPGLLGGVVTQIAAGGKTWFSQTRRLGAGAGVIALLALGFAPEGDVGNRIALLALAALALATMTGWLQAVVEGRFHSRTSEPTQQPGNKPWFLVSSVIALVVGLAVQTWFQSGTSIAGGDLTPPEGTAWLGRLFEPWAWTGSNLGEPSQLPMALPWAAVLEVVHALGGDPSTAQRIWYTALYIGVALSALGLLAALRMGPVAAAVGAIAYVFNPYVVSVVNTYPVYAAGACLLAALPAAVVAVGTRRLSVRWGAALVAASGPLVGYVFFSPPLVGMILGLLLAATPLVAWVYGREAAIRSVRALLLAVPLFLVVSAYWIVPAILHLSGFGGTQLADLSSWTWTESRATIRNAFWLNTIWGWSFPQYFPFAPVYSVLPLSAVRFILPAIAFGALALTGLSRKGSGPNRRAPSFRDDRLLRLAIAAAASAVAIIFVSTGTNPPGNIVFGPLYNLPFGWLLREPGRFLMVVALAYAVLVAITVEALLHDEKTVEFMRLRRLSVPPWRLSVVPVALATSALVGFPLYTGAVVPDSRIGLPSERVRVPAYWKEMAGVADALPTQGALLVLPPDDFYQMPYTWGYYGADGFIVDLFQRPVLVPNLQGYSPASSQLMSGVNLMAQSILNHDWGEAGALAAALNAPLVLVRRDIDASFPGRSIVSPVSLADALRAAPNFVLVRQIGSLELFAAADPTTESELSPNFVTTNAQTPDLRVLSLLPPRTSLVSVGSQVGVANVVQAPPLDQWQTNGLNYLWEPNAPPGSDYRLAELNSRTVVPLNREKPFISDLAAARVVYAPTSATPITVSVAGRTAISNGDFSAGQWGSLGDCNAQFPSQAKPLMNAHVITNGSPGGLPALQLSASLDSACESRPLDWHGGPILLSLMIHAVQGSAPRICLWETGVQRCSSVRDIPGRSDWFLYQTSAVPDPGTTALDLFLYADALEAGRRTVNEYANVRAIEVPALPSVVLLAAPPLSPTPSVQLYIVHNSFSTEWQGSTSGTHVLVDGMLNGWLIPVGSSGFSAHYGRVDTFRTAEWVSVVAVVVILVFLIWIGTAHLARRRAAGRP